MDITIIISSKCNWFSPCYDWKITFCRFDIYGLSPDSQSDEDGIKKSSEICKLMLKVNIYSELLWVAKFGKWVQSIKKCQKKIDWWKSIKMYCFYIDSLNSWFLMIYILFQNVLSISTPLFVVDEHYSPGHVWYIIWIGSIILHLVTLTDDHISHNLNDI